MSGCVVGRIYVFVCMYAAQFFLPISVFQIGYFVIAKNIKSRARLTMNMCMYIVRCMAYK